MITVIVKMQVKPHKEDEFLSIFREVASSAQTQETGCVIYAAWKTEKPYHYYHIASYRDQAARDYHETLHKDDIGPRFLPCLEGDPQVDHLGPDVLFVTKDQCTLSGAVSPKIAH